jgi:hypothetical protein
LTMAVAGTLLLAATSAQAVENGVASGPAPQVALPNFTNFDPPSAFASSLPLKGFYLNSKTKMNFTAGNGGVLNSGSNFGVSGFSPPNFLAFNCGARNSDSTIPALPLRITFSSLVTRVSMNVGNSSGGIVTLNGLNAGGGLIAQASVNATSALQTLQITRPSPSIKKIVLTGPCVLVVDDISAS